MRIIDEERETVMTDTKIKLINQPGDYYFCSLCAAWHRCTNDPSSSGNQHILHLVENITNSPSSKYYFCTLCVKWHADARKDHLQYRLHIQHFNRKNGFSFIVKGLKIAEIKLASGGFILTLIQNILNQGYTSVHQEKKDFVYPGSGNHPISDTDLRTHFIREAKNLISLRKNNTIGYREKWLHSLLIEKMQDGSLTGLDLEFLYYETPVGKVRRNKQFGWEHIDILAKERHSRALVVVEVKKQGDDLGSAISQGLSYVEWLFKYRERLKG
jgi:hypothetical protein